MPPQFKNYDPGLIVLSLAGIPIGNFAEGTFVTAERATDAFATQVGAGGDVTRVRSRNKTGTVTFTVMAESPSNDALSALHLQDEALGTGAGTLSLTNLNGTTLVEAPIAWIQKVANVTYGDQAEGREWVVACSQLEMFVGGALV